MNLFEDLLHLATNIVRCPIEAAMKSLRRGIIQIVLCSGLLITSIILLLAGVGFIVTGIYMLLVSAIANAGLAAVIVGVVISLAAILMMVIIRNLVR